MKELTYFNGEMVESGAKVVSLDDRGYCFGDGVYEVVRVYNGRAFAFSYHQDRLYRSMREMDIPVRMPPDELQELHEIMIEQSEITDGYIYLQITRGVTPRHHAFERSKLEPQMYMFIKPITTDLGALQEGVKAITLPDERWARVDIKTLNLIPNILAQTKAEKKGAYTAILVRDGIVTEGATSNVFVMKDGVCYTHPANHHILKGITRQLVVTRVAPTAGITIIEREFDEAFLKDADEIFFTDTIGGIIPITTLNREPVGDGKPGKAAKVLAEQLQHLMEEGLA
ncbi:MULTISPECIES: D-amino-acid transaminase [unclassified Veillonella]|jgi:D-amino-acid transaminase|uniref:D-amino-acid transaminase n=1 Tax=unclassified Veillonella TaxID=2630086 RepID=UPI00021A2C7F|nr:MULTISPECIES: D-amino-acid transaminase [unclassified Veillonella]EGS39945.1 D-amino-acid transaminase [Veillonella sp. oral taxon 780 str. F0422]KXB89334.1 D-amino-acid transaminase [Veillonella sp. DNF00869]MBS6625888.1 D-amino-acid transaminase [Veillonella sp. oral taxon 780]